MFRDCDREGMRGTFLYAARDGLAFHGRCQAAVLMHGSDACSRAAVLDLADSGRVVFGPAARTLPQLPIAVDSEGYLVAQSDFTEPVGPSYWERDSK